MSELQLELPQVSFGRYLDLLRRRRWQLVPVSLLGLLVGGMVAFFIPRYYVAETRLEYVRMPTDVQISPLEDPFKYVIDNAQIMLPQAASAAMQKLGWPESRQADALARRESERQVENNVQVYDANPSERRTYAQVIVLYRDRDGQRAAEFLNQLVDTWMDQRLGEMRAEVEKVKSLANQHMNAAATEWSAVSRDLTQLSSQYGFLRLLSEGAQQEELRVRTEALKLRTEKLDEAVRDVASLEALVAQKQRQIDSTLRTVDPSQASLADRFKPGSPEAKMFAQLQIAQEQLDKVMGTAHPDRAVTEAMVKELRDKLEQKLAGGGEVLNPAIEKLRQEKQEAEVKLAGAIELRDQLKKEIAADSEAQTRRAQAEQDYLAKRQALAEAQKKREAAIEELDAAMRQQNQLDSVPPIRVTARALVPKRPTEPNILLVAVLGCVVGLGVAIGLILLIDLLQGTLKTLDDAERALPVPVLGGVSYLETKEQQRRASMGRRRASLVAGCLLLGAVVVVTTYYVAPQRLPPFARDLLSMVLGG